MPGSLWGRVFLAEGTADSANFAHSNLVLVAQATNTGVTLTSAFLHSQHPICQRISELPAPSTIPRFTCRSWAPVSKILPCGLLPGEHPVFSIQQEPVVSYHCSELSRGCPSLQINKTVLAVGSAALMTKSTPALSPLCSLPQGLCPGWELPLSAVGN